VDDDPDVDAIYRMTANKPCVFSDRDPLVLGKHVLSPYNSQNTLTRKALFPLLYLPAHVSFRFTDILRSLVAQPIMWLYDYHLGIQKATVVQQRNEHDYFEDFLAEIPMYRHVPEIADSIYAVISSSKNIADNMTSAYEKLHRRKIVRRKELIVLEAWLREISGL
jgi:hypothetical protein